MTSWTPLTTVEGRRLLGGIGKMREAERTERGLLLEIHYPAGVGSPEHVHDHDSFIYLLSGHLRGTIEGRAAELFPGETLIHPAGAAHSVEAVVDSQWLEFKTPPTVRLG